MTELTEEKHIQELGGAVEEISFEWAGLNFKVPSYPSIVRSYIDEKLREGYLIQEVPGGYRYISVDLPEFDVNEAGEEYQLPAPDEFGSVVESVREAVQRARDHLHSLMGEDADGYREWSKRLAEDSDGLPLENIVESYIEDGTGYLIQKVEDGLFRWIYVEPGLADELFEGRFYTPLSAIQSAYSDWLSVAEPSDANSWSNRLYEDAYREDSYSREQMAEYLAAEFPSLASERIEELARHLDGLASK